VNRKGARTGKTAIVMLLSRATPLSLRAGPATAGKFAEQYAPQRQGHGADRLVTMTALQTCSRSSQA